jgi:hypothetical protein
VNTVSVANALTQGHLPGFRVMSGTGREPDQKYRYKQSFQENFDHRYLLFNYW